MNIIISGGSVDIAFLKRYMDETPIDSVITADKGMEVAMALSIRPDAAIGDFDSASKDSLNVLDEWEIQGTFIKRLNPIKDETDTHEALLYALEHTEGDIALFGATGTRMDHMLGNISVLGIAMEANRHAFIIDLHNRIRLINKPFTIRKNEQYGQFFSIIPYGGTTPKVTLKGFKYLLNDYVMGGYNSLGISNEIVEDEASVEFSSGVLIIIEAME